jgi:hypothetical protein
VLAAFERRQLSEHEFEGLLGQLLNVAVSKIRGEAQNYDLATAEIKRALTVGSAATRRNVAWQLWRLMGEEEDGIPPDRAERWRTLVGPLFKSIWPLDAHLRDEETSRNLVLMALEASDAFPEAVESVLDFLVPYQLYLLAHSLRLEPYHEELVRSHPRALLRLANALIDPSAYPPPSDLTHLLQECVAVDPRIVSEPAYIRLFGLRREIGA